MMLRTQLRQMIRFDGDYLKGFSDLVTDGKVNLAVDKQLDDMINNPSEQLVSKDSKQRVAVAGPEFVRWESDAVAEGPSAINLTSDRANDIDEILILDILEQIKDLSKKNRARLMELYKQYEEKEKAEEMENIEEVSE